MYWENLEILVGTGGWEYLPVEAEDKLREYGKLFDFVEVNSTFYQYPRLSTVRSWRQTVPDGFVFSVKCHRDATHVYGLRPVEGTFQALERMFQVCRFLRSDMLVLQTPASMVFNDDFSALSKTLANLTPSGTHLIWEARRPGGGRLPESLMKFMAEENIVQAVDLTRRDAPEGQEILYSRVFGREGGSLYPLSNPELDDIVKRISRSDAKRAILTFHGFRMYQDAITVKSSDYLGLE